MGDATARIPTTEHGLVERTLDTVVREISEEIGATFVPDGGRAFDDAGSPGWAERRSIAEPPAGVALHPDELQDLLTGWLDGRA